MSGNDAHQGIDDQHVPHAKIDLRTHADQKDKDWKNGGSPLLPRESPGIEKCYAQTREGKGEKPDRCFDSEDYREKVPPALHAVPAEQVTRMTILVVLVNGL